jgi:membrane-bound lytic murein transglycosylase D
VPNSKAKVAKDKLPSATSARPLGSHVVRWGETLAAIAHAYETSSGFLEQLNDLYPHESPRPGTTLFVPKGRTPKPDVEIQRALGAVAVVPDHAFDYKDRRRLFYEPIFGDTVEDVARVCGVKPAEIRRWNHLEARANLQEGMRLQLFLRADARPANVLLYEAPHVDPLTVESERFFSHYEAARGRKRIEVTVAAGDTWKSLSQRYGLSLGSLERINHKSRRSALQAGDKVIVYAKIANLEQAEAARDLQDMAGAQALADAPPSDTAPSDTAPSDTTPSDTTQGDGPLDGAPSDGTAPSGAPQATSGQRLRAGAKRD